MHRGLLLIIGLCITPANADVVVSISNASPGPGGGLVSSGQYLQTSCIQNGSYDNVSISAWLFGTIVNGSYAPTSGTAYLRSAFGGGSSFQQSFVFPDPTIGKASLVSLFYGLSLPADTYLLRLASSDPFGGGWSDMLNGGGVTATLANGVTLGPLDMPSQAI